MMAELATTISRDPEMEEPPHASSSSTIANPIARDKELSHVHSIPSSSPASSSRHDSINSIDSDPLEPLERALTPNQETAPEQEIHLRQTRTAATGTSIGTTGSRMPDYEVDFEPDDRENPRNWPLWYRGMTIGFISFSTWTIVLYSTSYVSGIPGMMKEFGTHNQAVATLGVTTYLLGLAAGSLLCAPLSEQYGRRPVYIGSLALYCVFIIPCALATSLQEVIVIRFFGYVR